jgi:hypothetical protein
MYATASRIAAANHAGPQAGCHRTIESFHDAIINLIARRVAWSDFLPSATPIIPYQPAYPESPKTQQLIAWALAAWCLVFLVVLAGRPSFTNASVPVRGVADPVVALQTARDAADVEAIMGDAPSADREVMRIKQYVDFALIAGYLALALVIAAALVRTRHRRLALLIGGIAVLAALKTSRKPGHAAGSQSYFEPAYAFHPGCTALGQYHQMESTVKRQHAARHDNRRAERMGSARRGAPRPLWRGAYRRRTFLQFDPGLGRAAHDSRTASHRCYAESIHS